MQLGFIYLIAMYKHANWTMNHFDFLGTLFISADEQFSALGQPTAYFTQLDIGHVTIP